MHNSKPSPKLFIAVPVHGSIPAHSAFCFVKLAKNPPIDFLMATCVHDSLITRARNRLTEDFLQSDCEKLLWIDSDLVFKPTDVLRIASHEEDVVGGFYAVKTPAPQVQWCVNGLPNTTHAEPDARGLSELGYVGTGFMCIHRRVFQKMRDAQQAAPYRSDYEPHRMENDYWSVGVHQGRYLSEDWMFCQRWRELGGKVWGDCAVMLRHLGEMAWPFPGQNPGMQAVPAPNGPEALEHNRGGSDNDAPIHRLTPAELAQ